MASKGSSHQFLQLNEIRSASDADFEYFIRLAEEQDGGWIKKLQNKDFIIWQKETGTSSTRMAKLYGIFPNISAGTAFDTLLDAEYRKVWDDNMIEDRDLYKLDNCNDIGYYSMKCPGPVKNRDFVNQRSWRKYSENQYVLFNHSITVKEIPVSKKFIRGVSHVTGFLMRNIDNGVAMTYVTQSDPKGNIPSWIINFTINKIAPSVFNKLFRACCKYEEWKSHNRPGFKPWRYPEQNELKLVDPAFLIDSKIGNSSLESDQVTEDQEESLPETEEEIQQLTDHIVETIQDSLTNGIEQ